VLCLLLLLQQFQLQLEELDFVLQAADVLLLDGFGLGFGAQLLDAGAEGGGGGAVETLHLAVGGRADALQRQLYLRFVRFHSNDVL
jgi:hypothetical protein